MTEELAYQVKTDVYEGPFDLLLKAVDDGEIDIYRVSLAQVTASYFAYWHAEEPDLLLASDFLYMAAYLIELKSRQLLPSTPTTEEEGVLGVADSLVDHLQEYQLYKQIAQGLKERKAVFERIYGRHEGEAVEGEIELTNVSLKDLLVAFQKVYREAATGRRSLISRQKRSRWNSGSRKSNN